MAKVFRYNHSMNGVELMFDFKPREEIRTQLKNRKFRWSRNKGIWYKSGWNESDITWIKYLSFSEVKSAGYPKATKPKMKKSGVRRYNIMHHVGSANYIVNFHDGIETHNDGSDFFDIRIFKNKKDLSKFEKKLLNDGYVYGSAKSIGNLTGKKSKPKAKKKDNEPIT